MDASIGGVRWRLVKPAKLIKRDAAALISIPQTHHPCDTVGESRVLESTRFVSGNGSIRSPWWDFDMPLVRRQNLLHPDLRVTFTDEAYRTKKWSYYHYSSCERLSRNSEDLKCEGTGICIPDPPGSDTAMRPPSLQLKRPFRI